MDSLAFNFFDSNSLIINYRKFTNKKISLDQLDKEFFLTHEFKLYNAPIFFSINKDSEYEKMLEQKLKNI